MKEGKKPEYPEKTPGDELQKMPHNKARRFKSQARLEPAQKHWWQARKADVITVTPRVAPAQNSTTTRLTETPAFLLARNNNSNDYSNHIQRLLTAPRTISNTYAQVARAQSRANLVQHIERLSRATCQVVQRDSSAIKFDKVAITGFVFLALFHWLNHSTDEGINK